MRAITVRQPWAWAIFHGKDVENRSRNIAGSYRGPVAIHAAKLVDPWGIPDVARHGGHSESSLIGLMSEAPLGAIIGVVDLVDVHSADSIQHTHCCYSAWGHQPTAECDAASGCSPWAEPGQIHLVLSNPRPLPVPIPARGRLGLWTVPEDIAARIEATS